MSGLFLKAFSFFAEKVLRLSKEKVISLGAVGTIIKANILHEIRAMRKQPLRLQNCNETLQFPLPNRWSSPAAKQQKYMLVKQIILNLEQAGLKQRDLIDQRGSNVPVDRSRTSIEVMDFLKTIHVGEIDNVETVSKRYNVFT